MLLRLHHVPRSLPRFARLRLALRLMLVLSVGTVLLIFTPRIVMAVAVVHLAMFGALMALRVDAVRVAMGLRPLCPARYATRPATASAMGKSLTPLVASQAMLATGAPDVS